jgi:hypothetical protein
MAASSRDRYASAKLSRSGKRRRSASQEARLVRAVEPVVAEVLEERRLLTSSFNTVQAC